MKSDEKYIWATFSFAFRYIYIFWFKQQPCARLFCPTGRPFVIWDRNDRATNKASVGGGLSHTTPTTPLKIQVHPFKRHFVFISKNTLMLCHRVREKNEQNRSFPRPLIQNTPKIKWHTRIKENRYNHPIPIIQLSIDHLHRMCFYQKRIKLKSFKINSSQLWKRYFLKRGNKPDYFRPNIRSHDAKRWPISYFLARIMRIWSAWCKTPTTISFRLIFLKTSTTSFCFYIVTVLFLQCFFKSFNQQFSIDYLFASISYTVLMWLEPSQEKNKISFFVYVLPTLTSALYTLAPHTHEQVSNGVSSYV